MLLLFARSRPGNESPYLLALLFILLGFLRAAPFLSPPTAPNHLYNQIRASQELTLNGVLQLTPEYDEPNTHLLLAVDHLLPPTGPSRPASGLVRLTLRGECPPALRPGDRFAVRAILDRVRPATTPGAFDYRQYLADQGIWIIGRVRSPANIQPLHALFSPPLATRLLYQPERWRQRLIGFIRSHLPPATATLYNAILFGELSGITPLQLENYKAAGCLHLLAISGLNIGILAMVVIVSLSWLLTRSTWITLRLPVRKIAVAAAIVPLTAYTCLAGLHFPVLRALLMAAAFMSAILLDRQWSIVTNLALAALVILVWQPPALFTISFQLSFAAVLAIAVILPRLRPLFPLPTPAAAGSAPNTFHLWWQSQLRAGLTLAMAATLGTLPLLLFYFNRFSPYSAISTLLIEPLLCFWAMMIGLLACLLIPITPSLASQLLTIGGWGITLANHLAAFFAALPASSIWLPTPSPLEVGGTLLLLYGVAVPDHRATRTGILLAGLGLGLVALLLHLHTTHGQGDRVAVLDLGQGSGTVLQLRGGHTILVDGGGGESPRFNVGERLIAPYLWQQRIGRLEMIIVSHPHADHYNGLPFILEHFRPKELWVNGQSGDPFYQQLLTQAARLGVAVRTPTAGSTIFAVGDNRLLCLSAPSAEAPHPLGSARKESSVNSKSLVLRLESGALSLLLPGDLETAAEQLLVSKIGKELRADLLLAPHHGSKSSSSDEFLQAVAPRYVAISSGAFQSPKFPDPERLASYRRLGAEVYQTATDGTIFFTAAKQGWRVSTYLKPGELLQTKNEKEEKEGEEEF